MILRWILDFRPILLDTSRYFRDAGRANIAIKRTYSVFRNGCPRTLHEAPSTNTYRGCMIRDISRLSQHLSRLIHPHQRPLLDSALLALVDTRISPETDKRTRESRRSRSHRRDIIATDISSRKFHHVIAKSGAKLAAVQSAGHSKTRGHRTYENNIIVTQSYYRKESLLTLSINTVNNITFFIRDFRPWNG